MAIPPPKYPVLKEVDVSDDYFGTPVADPFRWLEDAESPEVKQFTATQHTLFTQFLDNYKDKGVLEKKLKEMWNYPRYECFSRHGDKYFYVKNSGLQNQGVMYVTNSLEEEGEVFLDLNALSAEGNVSLSKFSKRFSDDGKTFAYGLCNLGSDWVTIHFRDVETRKDHPEVLKRVKYCFVQWTKDNKGIFYECYPEVAGKTDGSETASYDNHKVYYHLLGTNQSEDVLIAEFPDQPKWFVEAFVSECGNYLLVTPSKDDYDNLVYYANISEQVKTGFKSKLDLIPLVPEFSAYYEFLTNDETLFYFRTYKNAPNYKIVTIDLSKPINDAAWTTVVPENPKNVMLWAACVNSDKIVLCYIEDVKNTLELRNLKDGSLIQKLPLDVGWIAERAIKRNQSEFFFHFESYLSPGRSYHVDFTKTPVEPKVIRDMRVKDFDPAEIQFSQVFYSSHDGTKIPMYIMYKKGLVLDGTHPCYTYGYGGFNHPILPRFNLPYILWMQHYSAIVAVPNIRGGGEYGEAWHSAGRLLNKQNCFDDFKAAIKYIIDNKYTSPSKVSVYGVSNGGLTIGGAINQFPELFKAAIAKKGVQDMLRYHKFTGGHNWCTEYGSPEEKIHFENLIKYSPIHNIRPPKDEGVQYPAVMFLTADHDDRVVSLHSYKYIARLQKEIGSNPRQTNPFLMRCEANAGHGFGQPLSNTIDEIVDIISFLALTLEMTFDPNASTGSPGGGGTTEQNNQPPSSSDKDPNDSKKCQCAKKGIKPGVP